MPTGPCTYVPIRKPQNQMKVFLEKRVPKRTLMILNPAALASLLSGKMDLATAAATFGLEQQTLITQLDMVNALTAMAEAASCGSKVEVFFISGAPAMMKGKRVRILAVLGDFPDEEKKQQLSS